MTKHYTTLDGLRGVAAIAVLLRHVPTQFGVTNPLPGDYLAVDFFFALSGFVLAHAYERRLATGMTLPEFTLLRLIRLYPLYFAAGVLALLYQAARVVSQVSEPLSLPAVAVNFLLLPSISPDSPYLYTLNLAAWSLAFEIVINVAFAAWAIRTISNRLLAIACGAGAVALIASALAYGHLDTGPTWENWPGGIARIVFSFCAGLMLHRIHERVKLRLPVDPFPLLALALTCLFWLGPTGGGRVAIDLLCALIVFPAIILLGAAETPSRPFEGVASVLGNISYSLYIIHVPLCFWAVSILGKLGVSLQPWMGFALSLAILVLAYCADRYFDRPVRRMLTRLARSEGFLGADSMARAAAK